MAEVRSTILEIYAMCTCGHDIPWTDFTYTLSK